MTAKEHSKDLAKRREEDKALHIGGFSGISLEKLKLQKECYRERKERNGKAMIYVICIMDIFRNKTLLFQKGKKYKLLDYNSFQYFIDGGEGGEIFSRIEFDKWFNYERD